MGNSGNETQARKYKTVVTEIGKQKMVAAGLTGAKVKAVTAVVGDGGGAYYLPTENMTALMRERWRGAIAGDVINEASTNMRDIKIVVPATVGGFTARECGVLDEEGDLIALCNLPDTEKAALEDGLAAGLTILMHIILTDGEDLDFAVDPSIDTATISSGAITIPKEGWAKAEGEEEYKLDVEVAEATAFHVPIVALDRESIKIAGVCMLSQTVETLTGAVRFWAGKVPEEEMHGTLTLLTQGGSAAGGNDSEA